VSKKKKDLPAPSEYLTPVAAVPKPSGRVIGPYRLLQKVGEGGMGEVWEAEQTEPVRRRVALKVIKKGLDTRRVVARFEAERQALALMNHPNVAMVFDAGETPGGRPYFAMEFVKGEPITSYCDRHRLSTRERLELFIAVCDGVQHAHQKGIIHRDLKPSNILVTIDDEARPAPKIIDFGVAKATRHSLTDSTLFTEFGQLIGTPEYMSPEQAEMTGTDVDTRTDVFSLGIVLYELLAGTLPLDVSTTRRAGIAEIQRQIREDEPPRPSARVSVLTDESPAVLNRRLPDVATLRRGLKGDLDAITMKALEKERTRRYGSATELGADIRRFLNNEPVLATPASTVYKTRKFVRRHRLAVTLAGALALLVAGFAATMAVQARRIARERDRANQQAARAEQEAERARQVSGFLVDLFEISDPDKARGSTITAREVLDYGAKRIEGELQGEPELRAELMGAMGRVYLSLGLSDDAARLLRVVLGTEEAVHGPRHPHVATAHFDLAQALQGLGDFATARTHIQEAIAQRRALTPDDALALAKALAIGAGIELEAGDFATAESTYRESLPLFESLGSAGDADRADALVALAVLKEYIGRNDEVEPLYEEALAIRRSGGGDHEPSELAGTLSNMGLWLTKVGRYPEAERRLEESLAIKKRLYGEDHAAVALTLYKLAELNVAKGDPAAAEPLARRAVTILEAKLPGDHWRTAFARSILARALTVLGRYTEAEPLLLESCPVLQASRGAQAPPTRDCLRHLAELYDAWGQPAVAARYRAQAEST
jgi:non-specific serine/threonine protein kinase/serine/threonine-protein kinase